MVDVCELLAVYHSGHRFAYFFEKNTRFSVLQIEVDYLVTERRQSAPVIHRRMTTLRPKLGSAIVGKSIGSLHKASILHIWRFQTGRKTTRRR
jgi:hypothetical protein